ncbi:MAG: hypothetical protein AAF903_05800 [Pseudomonadota bacterium]
MDKMPVVPTNYEEWEHCITVECGIPLTAEFVAERIAALNDMNDYKTQRFIARWGEDHLKRTLGWFEQAQDRLSP